MAEPKRDHVDRFLDRVEDLGHPDIELEVEGIVDRIGGLNRRIKKGMETVLNEFALTSTEWKAM